MIRHVFKAGGRTLTEADMDALIAENMACPPPHIPWVSPRTQQDTLDMIAEAIGHGMLVTLDGKPVTRENA
jgi:hypothetical protein